MKKQNFNNRNLVNSLVLDKIENNDLLANFLLVLGGFIFLSIFSQLKIILPFTPVPISGATFAVILIGLVYGKKLAPITVLSYILAGTFGLPVFANFTNGLAILFGPSGGYIIGYFFAALICAYFADKGWTTSYAKTVFVIVLANIVLYSFGLIQLSYFIGSKNVLMAGLLPFIPGDIIKMTLVTLLIPTIWKFTKNN